MILNIRQGVSQTTVFYNTEDLSIDSTIMCFSKSILKSYKYLFDIINRIFDIINRIDEI